jgi:hypothetical protein
MSWAKPDYGSQIGVQSTGNSHIIEQTSLQSRNHCSQRIVKTQLAQIMILKMILKKYSLKAI